jgi:hypothetical protein
MSHRLHRNAWILRLTLLAAAGLPAGLPFASAQAQDYSIVYTFGSGGNGATDAAEDLTVLHEFSGSPKDGVPWASWITPAYGPAPSCPPLKRQSSRLYINVSIS